MPLVIQTFLIFSIAYTACKLLKLSYDIAAPAGMIGASNFFELAIAISNHLIRYTKPCGAGSHRRCVGGSANYAYARADCE